MEQNAAFWQKLDGYLQQHELVLDRPAGTAHPRYTGLFYPVDYGYLKGTKGGDGMELDVWRGSGTNGLDALLCTVDSGKGGAELKLLVNCREEEKAKIYAFTNQSGQMKGILVGRER